MRYFFIFICLGYISSCVTDEPDWVKEGKRELFEKLEQMEKSQERLRDEFRQKKDQFNKQREESNKKNQSREEEEEKISQVKEGIASVYLKKSNLSEKNSGKKCSNCLSGHLSSIEDPTLYVFMSFSIPDETWIQLSPEVEKTDGSFVLRGLPNQSFHTLAAKILNLKEKGVNAQIQLDPKQFLNYEVSQVPTFVVAEGNLFDKVSGNVSLRFALEKMAQQGETKLAHSLYKTIKDHA